MIFSFALILRWQDFCDVAQRPLTILYGLIAQFELLPPELLAPDDAFGQLSEVVLFSDPPGFATRGVSLLSAPLVNLLYQNFLTQ